MIDKLKKHVVTAGGKTEITLYIILSVSAVSFVHDKDHTSHVKMMHFGSLYLQLTGVFPEYVK